jgi:anti-anti-sigma regulatory factor
MLNNKLKNNKKYGNIIQMIKLPCDLTIAHLDEYRATILPLINNTNDDTQTITIDDSELARIDTLGVQFILAVITYIIAQGKEIKWQSSSTVLRESINQLGITDAILLQYIAD